MTGSDTVIALAHLQAAPDFAVGSGGAAVGLAALGLLDVVPPPVLERARWWERHIIEVETGLLPEGDGPPRCGYDPAVHTLAQREEAKAAELRALGERGEPGDDPPAASRLPRSRVVGFGGSPADPDQHTGRAGRCPGGGRRAAGDRRGDRRFDRYPRAVALAG